MKSIVLIGGMLAIGLIGCSTATFDCNKVPTASGCNQVVESNPVSESDTMAENKPTLVGGWAPAFFSGFDTKKLDSIVDGMNQNRIKHVVVTYPPQMQTLANKIHDYLHTKTNQQIPMEIIKLQNTEQVSYNMEQVIVTLYFR